MNTAHAVGAMETAKKCDFLKGRRDLDAPVPLGGFGELRCKQMDF